MEKQVETMTVYLFEADSPVVDQSGQIRMKNQVIDGNHFFKYRQAIELFIGGGFTLAYDQLKVLTCWQ